VGAVKVAAAIAEFRSLVAVIPLLTVMVDPSSAWDDEIVARSTRQFNINIAEQVRLLAIALFVMLYASIALVSDDNLIERRIASLKALLA
jgi:hypothetical protein